MCIRAHCAVRLFIPLLSSSFLLSVVIVSSLGCMGFLPNLILCLSSGLVDSLFSHTRGNIFSQFLHLWFRSFCFWHLTVGEPLTTAIKIVESDQNAADPQWLTDCSVVVACRTTLIRKQVLFVWSGSIPNHATFKSCRIQCTSHGSYQVLQHSVTMHCGIHPL